MTATRLMTAADLPLGLRLSGQAGWNQTRADWKRFLELQPDGCFVAEWDGTPVGTVTTCIFGDVAWIAMVLVDEAVRGRGIGTVLLGHALEFLERRGVATVRLDATPLGRPLYERLGFAEQYRLARYEGTLPKRGRSSFSGRQAPEKGTQLFFGPACRPEKELRPLFGSLFALDEAVTRTDRRRLLLRLFAEQPRSVCVVQAEDRPVGFLAARPGSRATHLGPCIASADAGPLLFAATWRHYAGQRVLLDIPVANEPASRLAEAQGLTVQCRLTRMCRGIPRCERVEWLWASSGAEKG